MKLLTSFQKMIAKTALPPHLKFKALKRSEIYKLRLKAFMSHTLGNQPGVPPTLIPSNSAYAHEYWLKRYANYNDDLYAQIEHGVYFGDNTSGWMNPIKQEWQIGSFITFGEYRRQLLTKRYPNSMVFAIGPYINYVPIDDSYSLEISQLLPYENARTLTAFPAHSTAKGKRIFSHLDFSDAVIELANEYDCKNLLVCLTPSDNTEETRNHYISKGFKVVSAGSQLARFLPRQKAIFNASDLTVSNDLGTHIGYSVAMNVPHAIVMPAQLDTDRCILDGGDPIVKQRQRNEFFSAFRKERLGILELSGTQKELVEYYWGQLEPLCPSELKQCFIKAKTHYYKDVLCS